MNGLQSRVLERGGMILPAQWEVWPGDTKGRHRGRMDIKKWYILPLQRTHGKGQDQNLTSRDGPRNKKRGTRTEQLL